MNKGFRRKEKEEGKGTAFALRRLSLSSHSSCVRPLLILIPLAHLLPRLVVEGAHLTGLQPPLDAVRVERVAALAPAHDALPRRRLRIALANDARALDQVTADAADPCFLFPRRNKDGGEGLEGEEVRAGAGGGGVC